MVQTLEIEFTGQDLIDGHTPRPSRPAKLGFQRTEKLSREVSRALHIVKRIGIRLERAVVEAPDLVPMIRIVKDDDGRPHQVPELDAAGQPVMTPWLPDEEWRRTMATHWNVVRTLLVEQREWSKMQPPEAPVDDATAIAELRHLAAEAIRAMPRAELDRLLRERDALDVAEVKP